MPGADVEFHPEAAREAKAAREWYAAQSSQAADAFVQELDDAIEKISDGPDRWSSYLHATRRYLMRRFPYLLVFRTIPPRVQVVAVAHAKRKPGYWKER